MELKSPKLHTLWNLGTCPWPPTPKCGNLNTSSPNLTQPCGWGRGPGVITLATHEQSAPIVPITRLLHVELAHNLQSPGIPSHTQLWGTQSAIRHQEQPLVRVGEVPTVQWRPWTRVANPGIAGKGGQCGPLPWQVEVYLWKKSLVGGEAHTYSTPSWSS